MTPQNLLRLLPLSAVPIAVPIAFLALLSYALPIAATTIIVTVAMTTSLALFSLLVCRPAMRTCC